MIPQNTINDIIETLQIEDVIGEFIPIKKRGVNFVGLCPFHNEKTPSFTVSPSKGIYKCFGCGAAGNAIKFLMEHEHYSYVESLKYLAKKYDIEIEETPETAEDKANQLLEESLYIITSFATEYFSNLLFNHDEGKSIGLSYFKERGFREDIITKFQLGYCLEKGNDFINHALEKKHQLKLLTKTGLVSSRNNENRDFFTGRIIFPIHNLTGKIIAFGGRTLKNNAKAPKYINSPETEIYHKSNALYGLFFAKKNIRKEDSCLLVEGYTDVLSLHQAGIENVISSSGTSLTKEQIFLIKRYTRNIVVLYDSDEAGIKAALRGTELILEEGMNVKIALLPDGNDPDSFIRLKGYQGFIDFLDKHTVDFVMFKTKLLLKETKDDPSKKSSLIREIVTTIGKIPDPIKRSIYIKECSDLFSVGEQMLVTETNKISRQILQKRFNLHEHESRTLDIIHTQPNNTSEVFSDLTFADSNNELQEKDIIRILLEYGTKKVTQDQTVASFILNEIRDIEFTNPAYHKILALFIKCVNEEVEYAQTKFTNHEDPEISKAAIEILSSPYELSKNWDIMHNITVTERDNNFMNDVKSSLARFKLLRVIQMIAENKIKLKNTPKSEVEKNLLEVQKRLLILKQEISKELGTVIH